MRKESRAALSQSTGTPSTRYVRGLGGFERELEVFASLAMVVDFALWKPHYRFRGAEVLHGQQLEGRRFKGRPFPKMNASSTEEKKKRSVCVKRQSEDGSDGTSQACNRRGLILLQMHAPCEADWELHMGEPAASATSGEEAQGRPGQQLCSNQRMLHCLTPPVIEIGCH